MRAEGNIQLYGRVFNKSGWGDFAVLVQLISKLFTESNV